MLAQSAHAVEMSTSCESEEQAMPTTRLGRKTKLAGLVSVVLLLSAVAGWFGGSALSVAKGSSGELTRLAYFNSGSNFTVGGKERDHCSAETDNCIGTKCCKTSGHICLQKTSEKAQCAGACPETGPCNILAEQHFFDVKERRSTFCFAVYTGNTGSTKKSTEKELLAGQFTRKVSLFACDAQDVYSDVAENLAPGLDTIKVEDVDNDFHFAKRKTVGTWINTGLFSQVWKAIGREGKYLSYDWTIKVDADCVFFPHKLINRIHNLPVPPTGAFLNNCENVDYGFFGSLEVYDKIAFNTLVANIDICKTSTVNFWKEGVKHGLYGPMGEDIFSQVCMEKNGVVKLDVFDMNKDGACPAKRPRDQAKNKKWKADCSATYTPAMHPFKKPAEYFACMSAAEILV